MQSLVSSYIAIALLAGTLTACSESDPVLAAEVAALGPEDPAVPVGPLHRPGQHCLACHADGSNATPYSLAGTIYQRDVSLEAANKAEVWIFDSAGKKYRAVTNCAGNFYVTHRQFTPKYPIWLTLKLGDHVVDMESPVYQQGSCAACHTDPASPKSAGRVFLTDDPIVRLPVVKCAE